MREGDLLFITQYATKFKYYLKHDSYHINSQQEHLFMRNICRKFFILIAPALLLSLQLAAQQRTITGSVVDARDNSAMIGVTVMEKGTSNGTVTDLDGKFTLRLTTQNPVLVFSSVGYKTKEVSVGLQTDIKVMMEEDTEILDELVVVGYGVQKKKLVTGATVQVGGENIQKLNTVSPFTALQSQTPGVIITQSSGQPGEGFKVNIRGIGTIGSYSPLYVIDGIVGGDINNLNPADIESIDVLKDAASAAIYGARAANGVILVTTKQGKAGKMQVTYDGYIGWQNVYKMAPSLNAREYMNVMDIINFNEGLALNDWESILGPNYESIMNGSNTGTFWLDEIRNEDAPVLNNALNITGGNDISKFSLGVSNTNQEGIFGKPVQSKFNRTTARINSDHVIYKNNDMDIIKVGENMTYFYTTKSGIGIGNQYWNDISNMLRAMPIMPVYDDAGNYYQNFNTGITSFEPLMSNPIANMVYNRGYNESKNYGLNIAAYLQIQPVKNLIFKSQYGYKMNASSYRQYQPAYKLSTSDQRQVSSAQQSGSSGWQYSVENTLNYTFKLNESHNFDALIGQTIEKWGMGESVSATNGDLLFNDFKHAYIDNTQGIKTGQTSVSGSPWGQGAIASFFGRVNYDWNETYMASLVFRADGSSNFARGHRWGYFPSVSLGWVMTNEEFMKSTESWLDFLKLRASWGQNGNCNIANFQYLATVSFDDTAAYSFGNNKDSQTTGGYPNILPNPNVTWETSEQINLGIDAVFLKSRLTFNFDAYNKKTKGWLVRAPQLDSYGTGAPYINGGDIENKGVEIAAGWRDQLNKDFNYGVNINATFNKNEVTRIANSEGIIHGPANVLSQGTTEMYRAQVGYPVGYFYGYKTAGIFQNQEDINAWREEGYGILQPNVQPGDVKFVDVDHNGEINEADKGMIGDPNPNALLGVTLNLGYKGFDLSVAGTGAFGQQIAKSYRKFGDGRHENYTTDVFEAWHGEGTSNKWPRLTAGTNANYMNISDIFIENGDYFKVQNVTLGYDFKKIFGKMPLSQARLYVTAQNLFTITGYSGMDPEIGGNSGTDDWAKGIDIGFYPSPRTFLVGINLKF
ncbi:SusC/RagA family protein [Dysgonamonadaceae bacterium]|nr:SusC/RagA family protein [Dysgonamonadaceae bacterium]